MVEMVDFFGKKKPGEEGNDGDRTFFKSKGPEETVDVGKVDSVIGPGLNVKGEIHSRGTLRVDGNVEGKISADASVVIGEKGVVKADIAAGHVIIGGTVHGKVTGREKVEILSTGRLYGDVSTKAAKFVVSEGVIFEGSCTMSQGDAVQQPQATTKSRREDDAKQEVDAAAAKGSN